MLVICWFQNSWMKALHALVSIIYCLCPLQGGIGSRLSIEQGLGATNLLGKVRSVSWSLISIVNALFFLACTWVWGELGKGGWGDCPLWGKVKRKTGWDFISSQNWFLLKSLEYMWWSTQKFGLSGLFLRSVGWHDSVLVDLVFPKCVSSYSLGLYCSFRK